MTDQEKAVDPNQTNATQQNEIESGEEATGGKDHQKEGREIVNKFMLFSMGIGLVPVPAIDLIGLAALQLRMLHRLTRLYGVAFDEQRAKIIIAAFLGTGTPGLASRSLASLLKAIPGVGSVLAFFSMSLLGGAATYALGRLFVYHFEIGGALFDLDPKKTRAYYEQLLGEGQQVTKRISWAGIKP